MLIQNKDYVKKDFLIREFRQEQLLAKEFMKNIDENDIISREILNSLSHELRTPVVAIKTYIDMLLKDHFGELRPQQREKIERIKENTDYLVNVIYEILEKKKKLKYS